MANFDSPNGFRHAGGPSIVRSFTSGAAVTKGDLLEFTGGKVIPYTEGAAEVACGVAATTVAATDLAVLVYIDPDAEFVVQCSGTFAATDIGTFCDVEGTTGIMEANENANVNDTLVFLAHHSQPGSTEIGLNSRALVKIRKHSFGTITP